MSFYFLNCGKSEKASSYLTIAMNMFRLIGINADLVISAQLLNHIGFMKLDGIGVPSIPLQDPQSYSPQSQLLYKIITAHKLLKRNVLVSEDVAKRAHSILDEGLEIIQQQSPDTGGIHNMKVILFGMKSIVSKSSGDLKQALDSALMATSFMDKQQIQFFCPLAAIPCFRVAKLHFETGQYKLFEVNCQLIRGIGAIWSCVGEAFQRFMERLSFSSVPMLQLLPSSDDQSDLSPLNSSDSDVWPTGSNLVEILVGKEEGGQLERFLQGQSIEQLVSVLCEDSVEDFNVS